MPKVQPTRQAGAEIHVTEEMIEVGAQIILRAHGDAVSYAGFRDRYRDMAKTLGFEGHIEWAEAMP